MFAFASIAAFGYTSALSNMLALPGDAFWRGTNCVCVGLCRHGRRPRRNAIQPDYGMAGYKWSFAPAFALFGCIPLSAAALIITLPESGFSAEAANRI